MSERPPWDRDHPPVGPLSDPVTAGIRLANRVSHLSYILNANLKDTSWIDEVGGRIPDERIRSARGEEWIVDELVDLRGEAYRRRQSELIALCLRSAVTTLAAVIAVRKPNGKLDLKDVRRKRADLLATSFTQEPAVALDALLPSWTAEGLNFARASCHFGSISFHRPLNFSDVLLKESFGDFDSLQRQPVVDQMLGEWFAGLADSTLSHPYHERYKKWSKRRVEDGLPVAPPHGTSVRLFFQEYVSPILEERQALWLASQGGQVPLILVRVGESDVPENRYPANILPVPPEEDSRVREFFAKCDGCAKCAEPLGVLTNNCGHLPSDHPVPLRRRDRFKRQLVWDRIWVDQSPSQGWPTCRTQAEFRLPALFFGQPVLISCAHGGVKSDDPERCRGPVSLSLAVHPGSVPHPQDLILFATVIASGLHQMVADVDGAITTIDHRVQSRRVVRHALRSSVSAILGRSMAHDVGSHMLASATLPSTRANNAASRVGEQDQRKDDVAFFDHIKQYVRHRMVFIAEAATSDPLWSQTMSLIELINTFRVYRDGAGRTSPTAVRQFLASSEEIGEVEIKCHDLSGDDAFAIPTGFVGAQALYCVLENVVRNGAKYGAGDKGSRNMDLHIKLDTDVRSPGLRTLRVWDSLSIYSAEAFQALCQFYPKHLWPPEIPRDKLEDQSAFVDAEGKPLAGGWGIKEMRIAAAWLRGHGRLVDLLERDSRDGGLGLPILKPVRVNSQGDERPDGNWIGVELFLQEPREVLVIGQATGAQYSDLRLRSRGIGVYAKIENALADGWMAAKVAFLDLSDTTKVADETEALRKAIETPEVLPWCLFVRGPYPITLSSRVVVLTDEEWEAASAALLNPDDDGAALSNVLYRWHQAWSTWPTKKTVIGLAKSSEDNLSPNLFQRWSSLKSTNFAVTNDTTFPIATTHVADSFLFDNHGAITRILRHAEYQEFGVEEYDSMSPTYHALRNPPTDLMSRRLLAFALTVAGSIGVIVLDERLAASRDRQAEHRSCKNVSHWESLKIDVVNSTFKTAEIARSELNRLITTTNVNRKVVVIHQGIFDKAVSENKDSVRYVEGLMKRDALGVVVISDRGQGMLPKLPGNARFLPYSTVERAMLSGSKLALVQAILSSRSLGKQKRT